MQAQQTMHATLTDVDATACYMGYVQLSLWPVPAIMIHRNALMPDATWGHLVTPVEVMGLWDMGPRCRDRGEAALEAATTDVEETPAGCPSP